MQAHLELQHLVIEFASLVRSEAEDMYPISEETHLFLALEQPAGHTEPSWTVVNPPDWNYSNVQALCRDRAWRAEQGSLLLRGERVCAENYLKAWRAAMAQPMSFPALLQAGFLVTAIFSKPSAYCAAMAAQQDSTHAFLKHLASPLITRQDGDRIEWTVPLTSVAALRTFSDLRSGYWSDAEYPGDFGLSWRVAGPTMRQAQNCDVASLAQDQLFAEAA